MAAYSQSSGRMFPTWSEVLEVIRSLGYEKPQRPASSASTFAARGESARDEASDVLARSSRSKEVPTPHFSRADYTRRIDAVTQRLQFRGPIVT